MSLGTTIVRKLREWKFLYKPQDEISREAEEIIGSEAVREDLKAELEQQGIDNFETVVDAIMNKHVYTSDAYADQPNEWAQDGMDLHARLALLHIIAASTPHDVEVPDKNEFEDLSVLEPLDIDKEAVSP